MATRNQTLDVSIRFSEATDTHIPLVITYRDGNGRVATATEYVPEEKVFERIAELSDNFSVGR